MLEQKPFGEFLNDRGGGEFRRIQIGLAPIVAVTKQPDGLMLVAPHTETFLSSSLLECDCNRHMMDEWQDCREFCRHCTGPELYRLV